MTKNTDLKELKITKKTTTQMNWHSNKPQGGVESDFQTFSIILLKCLSFNQKLHDMYKKKNKKAWSKEEKKIKQTT